MGARKFSVIGAAAAALLLAGWAAWAQGPGRNISVEAMRAEKRVALVLGNAGYASPAALKNPLNDASDMADTLRALGFDVVLHTDGDLKAMQRAVREFGARLKPDGIGLFYYAGHGVQVRGNNYLVPLGARISAEAEVEDEALDVNRVLKVIEESRSRVSIVALDACRDNPFARSFRSATRGLAVMPAPSGTFVAYATGPGAVAADGTGRNGLFTGELLRVMRTPGLDIVDVFRQVVGGVREKTQGRQVPWTLSSLDGYFMFSLPKGPAPGPVALAPAPAPAPPGPTITKEVLREYGSLAIRGRLAGVEVWIDEQKIGETERAAAIVLSDVAVGTYRVKARKAGHKDWEREVQVAANQRAEVVIDIEPLRPEPPKATRSDDGAEMVLVPDSEFWMGSMQSEVDLAVDECKKFGPMEAPCRSWLEWELPRHRVVLDGYYIDKYEVTNALYKRFMEVTSRQAPSYWRDKKLNGPSQPVVGVTWQDADAYCEWAGKRLPTEAEWEKAARGTDGRKYPWGDQWDASRVHFVSRTVRTAPVGSYPGGVSPYGAHDMAGNVWEWVSDWFDSSYYQRSPERNPAGPHSGQYKVLRGGSWHLIPFALRAAHRSSRLLPQDQDVGFRCAKDAK